MAKDVLSIQQLEGQLARREAKLEYLKKTNAPEASVETARKDMELTRRRLERARAADYDEEMQSLQRLGG